MDVKAYIESGILEAYALGSLEAAERAGVEVNLALYPEIAAELAAIEEGMLGYARLYAQEPPAFLEQQIWDTIREQPEAPEVPAPRIIPLQGRERSRQVRWQRAAIWIALLGSLLTNLLLWFERSRQQDQQLAMQQQVDSLGRRQWEMAGLLAAYEKERNMFMDPDMQPVVMHSMQPGHDMAGVVLFSRQKGDMYLALHNLPMPPRGKQYQLWVMQNGKPVDMGTISNDMIGQKTMKKMGRSVTGGEAFAISLEKEGGSPTPDMQAIQVMGKVTS